MIAYAIVQGVGVGAAVHGVEAADGRWRRFSAGDGWPVVLAEIDLHVVGHVVARCSCGSCVLVLERAPSLFVVVVVVVVVVAVVVVVSVLAASRCLMLLLFPCVCRRLSLCYSLGHSSLLVFALLVFVLLVTRLIGGGVDLVELQLASLCGCV